MEIQKQGSTYTYSLNVNVTRHVQMADLENRTCWPEFSVSHFRADYPKVNNVEQMWNLKGLNVNVNVKDCGVELDHIALVLNTQGRYGEHG